MEVTEIINSYVEQQHDIGNEEWEERVEEPHLHPSSLWFCRRKAILTAVRAFPEHPLHIPTDWEFDLYIKKVMRDGNVWEDENGKALKAASAVQSVPVKRYPWAGEMDFVLEDRMIIEHKTTADYNFRVKERLPYDHHLAQLNAYGLLYGGDMELALYYHGRGVEAEFRTWIDHRSMVYEGEIKGNYSSGILADFDLESEMECLEQWWEKQELPPKVEDPFGRRFGDCTIGSEKKGYRPGCPWFDSCWPEFIVFNGMVQR